MNESRDLDDLDFVVCSFCESAVPIWEIDENGECKACQKMDYVERQALIADEQVVRNDFRTANKM